MGLIRVDVCCGPKLKDNHQFFIRVTASEEVMIPASEHGLGKVPNITVYDLEGNEIEPEIQVNDVTFDITIRQEAPAIPIYIALN